MNYFIHNTSGKIYTFKGDCPLSDCTKLPQAKGKQAYADQCKTEFQEYLKPWSDKYGERKPIIYCNVTKVSPSGMSRTIEFYAIKDNELLRITHLVAGAGDYPLTGDGLRIGGCGMDMRFAALDSATVANNIDIRGI